MPSEALVGRVGGLAVAVGVGAAIMTGWNSGVAWADESADSAPSSVSGVASGEDTATANSGGSSATSTDTQTDGSTETEDESRSAPAEVIGTGGLTDEVETPPSRDSDTAVHSEVGADEGSHPKPGASKRSDRRLANPAESDTPAPVPSVAGAKEDADPAATAATEETIEPREPETAASLRTVSTQSPVAVVPMAQLTAGSTRLEPRRLEVVDVVGRLVTRVVSAILSPFAASNTPTGPVEAPSVWSLLAFVRREIETLFTAPSLVETRVDTVEVSAVEPEQRTLILTAFPAEADAILARTTLDPNPTVVVGGRHFYLGSMGGKKVIVAMTGIGMVNATHTTETALSHFTPESGISIGAVVFAGVAGGFGRTEIGSVAVPARWTSDDGATWRPVDAGMLAAANSLIVDLESTATLGDPLCLCSPLARLPLVDLNREPQLFVGGDGSSDDNNNGVAFPAIPFGGDVFGPQPCTAPNRSPFFTGNFFQAVVPFLAFGLVSNLTGLLTDVPPRVDAVDMETAAAQQVADAHGIPFLGIRGMSDGPGDPLNLPGYPFTFFVYKQIAADNAAIVTEAFLQSWAGPDD